MKYMHKICSNWEWMPMLWNLSKVQLPYNMHFLAYARVAENRTLKKFEQLWVHLFPAYIAKKCSHDPSSLCKKATIHQVTEMLATSK